MEYPLERLGPTGFQDLAAALAIKYFGPGVQAMGPGRDGGRDMYLNGNLSWAGASGTEGSEAWDGYTVFQVKHRAQVSTDPQDNASWLWQRVRAELDDWSTATDGRERAPDYLVFITNVPLSAFPGQGGHDTLNQQIRNYIDKLANDQRDIDEEATQRRVTRYQRLSSVRKWRFWDGHQIDQMLRDSDAIRRSFNAFLSAPDVLSQLRELTDTLPLDQLEPALRSHARTALSGEGFVYFDEAGSRDGIQMPLHEVAIDLPIVGSGKAGMRDHVIKSVLAQAEHVLKPGITLEKGPWHLVVAGAPGNGKTTVSRFLVQVYRCAMLKGAQTDISADQLAIIQGTEEALARFGCSLPRHRRWPMLVDLAAFAQELSADSDLSLLHWIAAKVSKRSTAGTVKPNTMQSWLQHWPWFLVLDGLDEVTAPATRRLLIERVTEFVNDADVLRADLFVLLTTRPTGFTETIAPTYFRRVNLDNLELDTAVEYGYLASRVRLGNDLDRIELIEQRLRKAADDEALKHLLRTPLQVLILSIIIDRAGRLPPDRYTLFWTYFDTVFDREQSKPGDMRRILQEHGQQIRLLHELAGFELQVRSEKGKGSVATLTRQELGGLAWQVLAQAGYQPDGKHRELLQQIVTAATHRLVLLAPQKDGDLGFDVRSLQELMAGKYLLSGDPEARSLRLGGAAASPHWRNSWLFAAGAIFAVPEPHGHRQLVELLDSIDEKASTRLGRVLPIRPQLAIEIIDDGMARSQPKWRAHLVAMALKSLEVPIENEEAALLARVLARYADASEELQTEVAEGLRGKLSETLVSQRATQDVQEQIRGAVDELRLLTRVHGLAGVRKHPGAAKSAVQTPEQAWADFDAEIETAPLSAEQEDSLRSAAQPIRSIAQGGTASAEDEEAVRRALADQAVAKVLEDALLNVRDNAPRATRWLRTRILPPIYRNPIGDDLRSPDSQATTNRPEQI